MTLLEIAQMHGGKIGAVKNIQKLLIVTNKYFLGALIMEDQVVNEMVKKVERLTAICKKKKKKRKSTSGKYNPQRRKRNLGDLNQDGKCRFLRINPDDEDNNRYEDDVDKDNDGAAGDEEIDN